MDYRDLLIRAAKTAAQSFVAVVTAAGLTGFNAATLEAAALAAASAGVSFLSNALAPKAKAAAGRVQDVVRSRA